jgi:triosephosphate isomerase (TIM)
MSETTARKPLVSGNWKMNLNHFEAIQLVQTLGFAIKSDVFTRIEVVLHPPFTDIRSVQTLIDGDKIPMILGAQNCFYEASGAYTGEISPVMLAKLNVSYVIVGHSERRQIFHETDETVNAKLRAVIANNMKPILCVGESAEERDSNETEAVVLAQIDAGLKGVSPDAVAQCVVAYEPIWAIGTGKNATPEDAQKVCSLIRSRLGEQWGDEAAQSIRIQYGGSAKPNNAADLIAQEDIDGFLVGGASIVADDFARIVTSVAARAVLAS